MKMWTIGTSTLSIAYEGVTYGTSPPMEKDEDEEREGEIEGENWKTHLKEVGIDLKYLSGRDSPIQ